MKDNKKINILQIIVVILTITLVFNIFICIFAFYDEIKEEKVEIDSLIYSLESMDYTYIMRQCYSMDLEEIKKNPDIYEFYCISKYFENTSLYKTYLGYDDKKAEKYKDNMDLYSKEILSYDYAIDEINGVFNIE